MENIHLNGKKYISSRQAAKLAGYTSDYVGQLCRGEKLDCTIVGRIWFVTEESILRHKELSQEKIAKASEIANHSNISDMISDKRDEAKIETRSDQIQSDANDEAAPVKTKSEVKTESEKGNWKYAAEVAPLFPEFTKSQVSRVPGQAEAPLFSSSKFEEIPDALLNETIASPIQASSFVFPASPKKYTKAVALLFLLVFLAFGYGTRDTIGTVLHAKISGALSDASDFSGHFASLFVPSQKNIGDKAPIENASPVLASASESKAESLAKRGEFSLEQAAVIDAAESLAKFVYRGISSFFGINDEVYLVEVPTPTPVPSESPVTLARAPQTIVNTIVTNSTPNTEIISYPSSSRSDADFMKSLSDAQDKNNQRFAEIFRLLGSITPAQTFGGDVLAINGRFDIIERQISKNMDNLSSLIGQTSKNLKGTSIDKARITNSTFDSGIITNSKFEGSTLSLSNTFSGVAGNFSGTLNVDKDATFGGKLTVVGSTTPSTLGGDFAFDTDTLYIDSLGNKVGIGTTTPSAMFAVSGDSYFGATSTIAGALGVTGVITGQSSVIGSRFSALDASATSTFFGHFEVGGNAILGGNSADHLAVNASLSSDLIPDVPILRNLGSLDFYWANAYIDDLHVNSISLASTSIEGTASSDFVLNSDNSTLDTENSTLIFKRGLVTPSASLTWDSASKRFVFNQPLYIENQSGAAGVVTLDLKSVPGQTANIFRVASSSGATLFNLTAGGNVGIGTTTPGQKLSVVGNGLFTGDITAANINATGTLTVSGSTILTGSSTAANFIATSATATSTFAGGINIQNSNKIFMNGLQTFSVLGASGSRNFFLDEAGNSGVTGSNNLGIGYLALSANVTGIGNICIGRTSCLGLNGVGTDYNIGIGDGTGQSITTGYWNVMAGQGAGQHITTGYASTLLGQAAGFNITTGLENIGVGVKAIQNLTTGNSNVAVGPNSLGFLTTGRENVAIGLHSGLGVATGGTNYASTIDNDMLFLGTYASRDPLVASTSALSNGTAIGYMSTVGCSNCIALGATSTNAVKVGIGSSTPSALLTISSSASIPAEIRLEDTQNNYLLGNTQGQFNFYGRYASTDPRTYTIGSIKIIKDSGDLVGGSAMTFSTQDSGATFMSEKLRITKTGNVGIGTTTPGQKLSVVGNALITGDLTAGNITATGTLTVSGSTILTGSNTAANFIATSPTATSTFAGDVSILGNVGIGTTTSRIPLVVVAKNGDPALVVNSDNAGRAFRVGTSDYLAGGTNGSVLGISMGAGTGITYSAIQAFTSGTTATGNLVLQNSGGNVGIGTTTPSAKLDINDGAVSTVHSALVLEGNIGAVNAGHSIDFFGSNGQAGGNAYARIAAVTNGVGGTGELSFYTNPSLSTSGTASLERLRIDGNGNVGIGTTTPAVRLTAYAGASQYAGFFYGNSISNGVALGSVGATGEIQGYDANLLAATNLNMQGAGGNLGIGVLSIPTAKLTVSLSYAEPTGGIASTTVAVFSNNNAVNATSSISILARSSAPASINFGSQLGERSGYIDYQVGAVTGQYIAGTMRFGTVGSDRAVIDGNGNMGIGTSTPGAKLHVVDSLTTSLNSIFESDSASANGAGLRLRHARGTPFAPTDAVNGDVNLIASQFYSTGAGADGWISGSEIDFGVDGTFTSGQRPPSNIQLYTNTAGSSQTERMRITSAGNVGIGTTSPYAVLSVSGLTASGYYNADSATATSTFANALRVGAGSSAITIGHYADSNNPGGLEARIGIGTTTPSPEGDMGLHVYNDAQLADATVLVQSTRGFANWGSMVKATNDTYNAYTGVGDFAFMKIYNSGAGGGSPFFDLFGQSRNGLSAFLASSSNATIMGTYSNTPLLLGTNNTERMRILNSGNVGIGTTTPNTKLDISGAGGAIRIESSNTTGPSLVLSGNGTFNGKAFTLASTGSGDGLGIGANKFGIYDGSAWRLVVDNSGNIGIGTTSPGQKLSVAGDILGNNIIGSYFTATSSTASAFPYASTTALTVSGNAYFPGSGIWNSDGKVGIGTTVPQTLLHLYADANDAASTEIRVENANTGNAVQSRQRFLVGTSGDSSIGALVLTNKATGHFFGVPGFYLSTESSFGGYIPAIGVAQDVNTRIYIPDSDSLNYGNVGIGTINPAYQLDVNGNINVSAGNAYRYDGGIMFQANTGLANYFFADAGNPSSSGGNNVAVGASSMASISAGTDNTAVGNQALQKATGDANTAMGYFALNDSTSGSYNTAIGNNALNTNVTGSNNTALGYNAGNLANTNSVSNGLFLGYGAGAGLQTGADNNILIGYQAGDNITTGANNIVLGHNIDAPSPTSANTLNIGNLVFGTGVNGTGTALSTGKIGIGTTTPGQKLSVVGNALITGDLTAGNITATGTLNVAGSTILTGSNTAANFIATSPTATSTFAGGLTVAGSGGLTVLQNGNVGIGTNTPDASAKLTVNGATVLSGNLTFGTDAAYDIGASGANRPRAIYTSGDATLGGGLNISGNILASAAPVNNITTVDSKGTTGQYTSIAMGSDGFARIAYHDTTNGDLMFAECTNAACTTVATTTVDSKGTIGQYPSLSLGSDGFARIAYYDASNQNLMFAQCTNAACTTVATTTVDSPGLMGTFASMALGSDGFARIEYINQSGGVLFAQCTNAACTTVATTTVDTTATNDGSMALGSDGFARIVYPKAGVLEFAQCTNAACTTKNITDLDFVGTLQANAYTAVTIGLDGFARIVYYNIDVDDLGFIQCTNADCSTKKQSTIDSNGIVGIYASMALGSDGFARIAYHDADKGDLKFFRATSDDGASFSGGSSIGTRSTPFNTLFVSELYAKVESVGNFDLAENYPTKDASLAAGDIVSLDENNPFFVKKARRDDISTSTPESILGIVSSKPGVVLGGFDDNFFPDDRKVPLALAGRVPVRVSLEGGEIKVGDKVELSSIAGVARKAKGGSTVIGVALEPYTESSEGNTIEVFVGIEHAQNSAAAALEAIGNPQTGDATSTEISRFKEGGFWRGLLSVFESVGIKLSEAFVNIKNLVADTFTVGTKEKPNGIVLFDEDGSAYCLRLLKGGIASTTPVTNDGKCPEMDPHALDQTASAEDALHDVISPSPEVTPSPSESPAAETNPDETASSTPSVSGSPEASPSESPIATSTPSTSQGGSSSESPTPSASPSATPSETPSATPSPSTTPTVTPSPSSSPEVSSTPSPSPESSPSPAPADSSSGGSGEAGDIGA